MLKAKYIQQLRNEGNDDLADYIEGLESVCEAVANIGVDFGYGPFQLGQDNTEEAREILSRGAKVEL